MVQTEQLGKLKFNELITSTGGMEVARSLVNSLISIYSQENRQVELISAKLRERCSGFFSESDRLLFEAQEIIQLSQTFNDPRQKSHQLERSLEVNMNLFH